MINNNWYNIYNLFRNKYKKKNIYEIYNELNKCIEINKIQKANKSSSLFIEGYFVTFLVNNKIKVEIKKKFKFII